MATRGASSKILKFLHGFEFIIVGLLMGILVLLLTMASANLVIHVIKDAMEPPLFRLALERLPQMLGLIMLILIGIELLETTKTYLKEHAVHAEVVVLVAIIAIARKVVVMDIKALPSYTLLGMGTMIAALSGGYYLIRRARASRKDP